MSQKGQMMEKIDAGRMMKPVAASVLLGAVVSVVILLLLSAVISSRHVPQSAIDPMAVFAISAGAFAAGLLCSRIVGTRGLMCGLFCGVIFSLIMMVCSVAVPDNALGLGAVLKTMLMLFSGMLGGVVGINAGRRKKR